jgi:iron complex outermembrane receptor protein
MLRPVAEYANCFGHRWVRPISGSPIRQPVPRWAMTLCACAALALPLAATAADRTTAGVTEETFLGEVPIVLSATRLSQPISETPASMTVISHDMIVASGALDIPQVLRLVPGFQVGHINGNTTANTYTVTYHGLSDDFARRMQVLVDGRSVYTPAFGGMDWAALPLPIEDVDRIEVIRGPNGVTYGANSFAAVINIITRHPSQDQDASAQYTGGDIDLKKGVVRFGATQGNLTYHLTGSYRQDSGFKTARPDAEQFSTFMYHGDYTATAADDFEIQLGYKDGYRGRGEYNDDTGLHPPRKEDVTEHFQQVHWRHTLSGQQETTLQFYHNYHRGTDTINTPLLSTLFGVNPALVPLYFLNIGMPPIPDQSLVYDQSITTERYDLEFQHTLSPYSDWRFVWGAESRLDRVRSEGYFNTSDYIDSHLYRAFGNAEWRLTPDAIANIGAMYEHNNVTGGDVSPRVGLNYHVTPTDTVRASVSRAYRTPSTIESSANDGFHAADGTLLAQVILSTRKLEPERITSYELGYLGEFPQLNTTLDLKVYREEIRNVIAYVSDTNVPDPLGQAIPGFKLAPLSFINDGYANTDGAELQARFHILPTTRLIVSEAYADQQGQYLDNVVAATYVDSHPSTPKWTTSALLMHRFPANVEASAAYYRVSRMLWVGQDTNDYVVGYSTLDARLARKFRTDRMDIEIALVGQNLLHDYIDFNTHNVLGKRYFLTLKLGAR